MSDVEDDAQASETIEYVTAGTSRMKEEVDTQYDMIEFLMPMDEERKESEVRRSSTTKRAYRSRSKLWFYYKKLDGKTAVCRTCGKTIRTCGNTTNLAKHLKIHYSENDGIKVVVDSTGDESPMLVQVKLEGPKPVITKVESVSVTPLDLNSLRPKPVDVDMVIKKRFLKKMKELIYEEDSTANRNITNALLYYICKDKLPFTAVHQKGFRVLMETVAPSYKIPRKNFLRKSIDVKFEVLQHAYKRKFGEMQNVSLSCVFWNDSASNRPFFSISVHFIRDNQLKSVCVGIYELTNVQPIEYIGDRLIEILTNWNIDKRKVVAVVTDNVENLSYAVIKRFGKYRHIICFTDTIDVLAESVLEYKPILDLLKKIRQIIMFVTSNIVIVEEMNSKQKQSGIPEDEVKEYVIDNSDNWRSTHQMMKRFMELYPTLDGVYRHHLTNMPTAEDLVIIDQVLVILEPFVYITDKLSQEKYSTISKVIPMINCILHKLKAMKPDNDTVNALKARLWGEVSRRFENIELSPVITLATFLDPRFKSLHFQDPQAASRVRRTLIHNVAPETDSVAVVADAKYDFWNHHRELADEHSPKKKSPNKSEIDEVSDYLASPYVPLQANPFVEWGIMRRQFPGVYKQAMKYLTVPASTCNDYIYRNSEYLGKNLVKHAFLASCDDDEWF